jgi:hypothetical protein
MYRVAARKGCGPKNRLLLRITPPRALGGGWFGHPQTRPGVAQPPPMAKMGLASHPHWAQRGG